MYIYYYIYKLSNSREFQMQFDQAISLLYSYSINALISIFKISVNNDRPLLSKTVIEIH